LDEDITTKTMLSAKKKRRSTGAGVEKELQDDDQWLIQHL